MTVAPIEGWRSEGVAFVRPATGGGNWMARDLPGGWCLRKSQDDDLVYRGLTLAVAGSGQGVASWAAHYDAHARRLAAWLERTIEASRPGPRGTMLVASKEAGDITVRVRAFLGESAVGIREGHFESATAAYVLGEDVLTGGAFVDDDWIGKGLGRALIDFGDEVSGMRSAPDERNGCRGTLSSYGKEFWRKRVAHGPIPGSDDPEGVARRLAEVERIQAVQWAERSGFLDVQVAVGLADAIGGEPVTVVAPDGDAKGWAIDAHGRTLTTRGWDSVPEIETRRGRARKGREFAAGQRGLLSSLSLATGPNPLVQRAVGAALSLHVDSDWALREARALRA